MIAHDFKLKLPELETLRAVLYDESHLWPDVEGIPVSQEFVRLLLELRWPLQTSDNRFPSAQALAANRVMVLHASRGWDKICDELPRVRKHSNDSVYEPVWIPFGAESYVTKSMGDQRRTAFGLRRTP